eukprot:1865111-Pyramimonas_sp.AAC.2
MDNHSELLRRVGGEADERAVDGGGCVVCLGETRGELGLDLQHGGEKGLPEGLLLAVVVVQLGARAHRPGLVEAARRAAGGVEVARGQEGAHGVITRRPFAEHVPCCADPVAVTRL